MEAKIVHILDNLTLEQTDDLLKGISIVKATGSKRRRIKRMVFEKACLKQKGLSRVSLRPATVVAAVLLVFASLSLIGFDKVAATIRNLFTYIPGVGIVEKDEALFYMIDPVVERTEVQDPDAKIDKMMAAEIVRAFYENGQLTVMVSVSGKTLITEDYTLFINDESVVFRKPGASMGISSVSPSWSWL
ncbi:MAG TPA: hypothetical protein DEB24_00930 [Coriobacteriia bacterium]|nr:hypothetical protein [Coriobacteriia bacterium]